MRRPILSLAATLALAACSDGGPVTPTTATDSTGTGLPLLLALAQAGIMLQADDGFEVTLASRECAAQGNTFSVTSPTSSTLTSDGCREAVGSTWTFPGPYPAGTTVDFSFFSGFTGSPGQIRVSGAYPTWTVACEDGADGDFNDLVFQVRATPNCSTGDPVLDDPAVRQQLKNLLQQSGAFNNNPSARREIGGYMYEDAAGNVDIRPRPDPGATPCSMSPGGPTPQPGERVVGVFHTHPFSHRDPLPANCNRPAGAQYDNLARGGGSQADWDLIQTPYQGSNLPMYIIDKDEVFRLDASTPPAARPNNPNRFQWNRPGCAW